MKRNVTLRIWPLFLGMLILTGSFLLLRYGSQLTAHAEKGVSQPVSASSTIISSTLSYQGYLQQGGVPVDDTCDFEFTLVLCTNI